MLEKIRFRMFEELNFGLQTLLPYDRFASGRKIKGNGNVTRGRKTAENAFLVSTVVAEFNVI